MSIEASMVNYYAERAKEYERIYDKPERQADLQRLRTFVENTFADADVFEVACGTGYWSENPRPLRRVGARHLDINEEVLADCPSQGTHDPQKIELHRADAYDLPMPSRKFTAAFSGIFWWSHIPKARIREFLLQGLHRILPARTKVVLMDNLFRRRQRGTPISHTDEQGNNLPATAAIRRQQSRGAKKLSAGIGAARSLRRPGALPPRGIASLLLDRHLLDAREHGRSLC